jgi:hypothetical protein
VDGESKGASHSASHSARESYAAATNSSSHKRWSANVFYSQFPVNLRTTREEKAKENRDTWALCQQNLSITRNTLSKPAASSHGPQFGAGYESSDTGKLYVLQVSVPPNQGTSEARAVKNCTWF